MKNFYNQLYTSHNQPSAERFSIFSDYESLPKLDNEKQNLCEGPITAEECLAALKTFQGLLFVLAVEPLAHQIRISQSIKGLENGNKITKLSLYADDTTAFIRDDSSAASLFTLLDQFGDLFGLKINKSKTEGLWLGSWMSRLGKDEPLVFRGRNNTLLLLELRSFITFTLGTK